MITHNSVMKILVCILSFIYLSIFLGYIPSGIACWMVCTFSILIDIDKLLSPQKMYQIILPPVTYEGAYFFHSFAKTAYYESLCLCESDGFICISQITN